MLDEATSHLDVDRERLINAAVSQMAMTRIVIAHRAETIASANNVIVLTDAGMVKSAVSGAQHRHA